jgi:hypothetical protein
MRAAGRAPADSVTLGLMVTDLDMPAPGAAAARLGSARRPDAGAVRFTARDIAGLTLTGDMYGAPGDLLGAALGVRPDRLRAITARWRRAGLAESGRIGPGPEWSWLTPAGMRAAGLLFPARRPPPGRLAHIRAVLAVRLSLQDSAAFAGEVVWWCSERRIRSAAGRAGTGHVPDAEVRWPGAAGGACADERWAIEAELTARPAARTAGIMTGLLARRSGWEPGARPGPGPRYDHVVYLCSRAARPAAERAAAGLPLFLAARVTIRELPPGALLP